MTGGGGYFASGMVMANVDLTPSATIVSFVLDLDLCKDSGSPLHSMVAI